MKYKSQNPIHDNYQLYMFRHRREILSPRTESITRPTRDITFTFCSCSVWFYTCSCHTSVYSSHLLFTCMKRHDPLLCTMMRVVIAFRTKENVTSACPWTLIKWRLYRFFDTSI